MAIVSRRVALGIGGVGVAALAAGGSWLLYEREKIVTSRKIDTHHHFLPKVYIDAVGLEDLASLMPNKVAPSWSVQQALDVMDGNGVQEGILSISSGPPVPDAANVLRKCNDLAATFRQQHADRFGSFASLPLPDMDASLKELSYSLDTLKADGVILFTNYGGKYLGDEVYAPLMDELNRRKAVAFIHPNHPPYDLPSLPPAGVLEFPFDTTRTAVSLIMAGAMRRWPDIKFILSHAGGTLPYLSLRLYGLVMSNPALHEKVGNPLDAIKAFWFDTALSMSKGQVAALLTVADPAKITFGTDFPMAPAIATRLSAIALSQASVSDRLRNDIGHGNAARLLGRKSTATASLPLPADGASRSA